MRVQKITIVAVVLLGTIASACAQGFDDDRYTRDFPLPSRPSLDLRSANCRNEGGKLQEFRTASRPIRSGRGYSAALIFHAVPDLTGEIPYCDKETSVAVLSPGQTAYERMYDSTRSGPFHELEHTGMRLIGWSPDGGRLLVDVPGTADPLREPIIYDALHRKTLFFSMQDALNTRFTRLSGRNCGFEFDIRVLRWFSNKEVLLRVTPPPVRDDPAQHPCVKRSLLYVLNSQSNHVRRILR